MTRYRYKTPTKTGRWVSTANEAREAAARAGEAYKDEATGQVYLSPLTEIERDPPLQ